MLSQTTEYALRAMACLACEPETLTPTPRLAERTAVPLNYLAKVLQHLAQSDLIRGRRGVGGGYRLARPADEISLLDIVNSISPVSRDDRGGIDPTLTAEAHLAALHRILDQTAEMVQQKFAGVTLADLVDDGDDTPATAAARALAHGGHTPHAHDGGGLNGHDPHALVYANGHAPSGNGTARSMSGRNGASEIHLNH